MAVRDYLAATMDAVILLAAIAAVALVAVAIWFAVTVGRGHRLERREVERMFSGDSSDSAWWEDRS